MEVSDLLLLETEGRFLKFGKPGRTGPFRQLPKKAECLVEGLKEVTRSRSLECNDDEAAPPQKKHSGASNGETSTAQVSLSGALENSQQLSHSSQLLPEASVVRSVPDRERLPSPVVESVPAVESVPDDASVPDAESVPVGERVPPAACRAPSLSGGASSQLLFSWGDAWVVEVEPGCGVFVENTFCSMDHFCKSATAYTKAFAAMKALEYNEKMALLKIGTKLSELRSERSKNKSK
ncbi:hypothetical protein MTO96_035204 [Rhipicephalus appendiculatus]